MTTPTARERAERIKARFDAIAERKIREGTMLVPLPWIEVIEPEITAAEAAAREEERAPMFCGHAHANLRREPDGSAAVPMGCLACAREQRAVEEAVKVAIAGYWGAFEVTSEADSVVRVISRLLAPPSCEMLTPAMFELLGQCRSLLHRLDKMETILADTETRVRRACAQEIRSYIGLGVSAIADAIEGKRGGDAV